MEYDAIQIVNDFISEEKLIKLKEDKNAALINSSKLNEEINLLYVAVTRAKNSIHIPEPLMPSEFPKSSQIHVMKVESEEEKEQQRKAALIKMTVRAEINSEKAYSVEEVRLNHKDAYKPWTPELDNELTVMFCEGVNIKDMAKHFGRTRGAITSRIKKLELEEIYR
jgi:ATP-dependent exoDNAse (exonuclease V) beta subunit